MKNSYFAKLLEACSFLRLIGTFSACLLSLFASAAYVPESTARLAGENFFTTSFLGRDAVDLTLVYTERAGTPTDEVTCFYVFNEAGGGFVIVAGDDIVQPVLAYSADRPFVASDIPINVAKWLEGYKTEILAAIANGVSASDASAATWHALLNGASVHGSEGADREVDPLLQTTWDQSPYYNAQCPGGSVSGCVATAMAQVMKYWNYPSTGSGFHQYNHDQYGTLSANFGNTSYQWGSMPNNVTSPSSAVATLMYHCGVSVDMQYSPTGSYAYIINGGPSQYTAENALEEFFGYQTSLQGVIRADYTDPQWINLLRTELDAGRPILHGGQGTGGGHAFVCDGYDDNNFFHFNWGWGGNSDGYYTINALNPPALGTGGGDGGFNSLQHAVIGIQPPPGAATYDMTLYDYVEPTSTTLYYGQPFSVTTNILNDGANTFNGDYCAAAFDDNGNFVGYVQVLSGYNLPPGNIYEFGLTFSTTGMFSMVPGTYSIGIFYRPSGGNWVSVSDNGSYYNYPTVTVVNENDIALYSTMILSPGGPLQQGSQVSVNLNIANYGATTFYGDYGVALYNLDGTWAQDVGVISESNGLPGGYAYDPPYLTFGPATITIAPGTYLLAVQHNPNGTGWQLTGSGDFLNPITVTVVAPALSPDAYEVNNTPGQSYTLPVNFSGNSAASNTNGSNLHITSDLDHYKIVLPSGYDYAVTARIHDSYNSGNGNTYTADALFSWSSDGTNWSATFDDIMANSIAVNNGGTIYFRVAPFFAGEVGTYLLQLNLTRTALVGIREASAEVNVNIFPNPASESLSVDLGDQPVRVERVVLTDLQGALIKDLPAGTWSSGITIIDVADLAIGCYVLQVRTDKGNVSQRVLVGR